MKESVSIVIPVFNESGNIKELINRVITSCRNQSWPFELILVDDGSSDDSAEIIRSAVDESPGEVIGVFLNRNYGQHSAIMAGFSHVRGTIVVTLDADLQNPPEEIPKLVDKIINGFDVVGGVRKMRQDTRFRKLFSWLVNRMTAKITGVNMRDYGCMLRAYRMRIVKAMIQCNERSTFIPVLANTFARHTMEMEVEHAARTKGDSKYNLWKLINLQFDLLTSMTTLPLRMLSLLGTIISIFGLSLGIFLVVMRLIRGSEWAAQGVFTLFAILFIFIGAQFIGMGLLGEYVGRIYRDVRARPRYLIHETKGESSLK
ncbi:MAG: glycosyltransferase [Candidatus Aureabacteria bacterium]|nr:glycosyltransferase [Candidatus Auribacterota bacterium]